MRSAIQTVFLLIFFLVFIFVVLILVNRKYGLFSSIIPKPPTTAQRITPTPAMTASITPPSAKNNGLPQFPDQTKGGAVTGTSTGRTTPSPTRIPNTGPETVYVASLLPILLVGLKMRKSS